MLEHIFTAMKPLILKSSEIVVYQQLKRTDYQKLHCIEHGLLYYLYVTVTRLLEHL